MASYLSRYIPALATICQPLYELVKSKNIWNWGHPQRAAFEKIKRALTVTPVLAFHGVNKPTAVSTSSYGLRTMFH